MAATMKLWYCCILLGFELFFRSRGLVVEQQIPTGSCVDSPACASLPSICSSNDFTLAKVLCPATCGFCDDGSSPANVQPDINSASVLRATTSLCQDHPGINCSAHAQDLCSLGVAYWVCRNTCGLCGESPDKYSCTDTVVDLRCSDLPDPCNDDLGIISCPVHCGLCHDTSSTTSATTSVSSGTTQRLPMTPQATPRPATPTTLLTTVAQDAGASCSFSPCVNGGSCRSQGPDFTCQCPTTFSGPLCETPLTPIVVPSTTTLTSDSVATRVPQSTATLTRGPTSSPTCRILDKDSIGCGPAEVVFLLAHSHGESHKQDINNQGDFINKLITEWHINQRGVRIGIVAYDSDAREYVKLTEFTNAPWSLSERVRNLTSHNHPIISSSQFNANVTRALEFVYDHSFKEARPGVPKVVIPIIHMMYNTNTSITEAANKLKASCTSIVAMTVHHKTTNYNIVQNLVNQPHLDHYTAFDSFNDLGVRGVDYFNCQHLYTLATVSSHSTTAAHETTTTSSTRVSLTTTPQLCHRVDKHNVGCGKAEVIFMIEQNHADNSLAIQNQGNFIQGVIKDWHINQRHIRVGIVAYDTNVHGYIDLTDFIDDYTKLDQHIDVLTHTGHHVGITPNPNTNPADLAKALDFVRTTSFHDARPGVPKVVIPIVHKIYSGPQHLNNITHSADRLKADCTSIIAMIVDQDSTASFQVKNLVSDPYDQHFTKFGSFHDLESSGSSIFDCLN